MDHKVSLIYKSMEKHGPHSKLNIQKYWSEKGDDKDFMTTVSKSY